VFCSWINRWKFFRPFCFYGLWSAVGRIYLFLGGSCWSDLLVFLGGTNWNRKTFEGLLALKTWKSCLKIKCEFSNKFAQKC
jgi:hypothetical protein